MKPSRHLCGALISLTLATLACGRTAVLRFAPPPFDGGVDAGQLDAGRDAGTDAGPPDAGPPDSGCVLSLPLVPALPTLMFVIDRSGSMDEDLDGRSDAGGASRWEVLEASLRSVLPPLDQQLAVGALFYPQTQQSSCESPTAIDLTPMKGNTTPFLSFFSRTMPLGGTPTADALALAASHLRSIRTATSARAVVLATDGAPNCNARLNERFCTCTVPLMPGDTCYDATFCLDDVRTLDQLRSMFQVNLPTYVIGMGSGLSAYTSTLDQMAIAGGVPKMGAGPRYYSAVNQAELTDAFTRITSQLTRCTFLVNGLRPNEAITVQVDGDDVPESPEGWRWSDQRNSELTLNGEYCDRAAMGAVAAVLVECR